MLHKYPILKKTYDDYNSVRITWDHGISGRFQANIVISDIWHVARLASTAQPNGRMTWLMVRGPWWFCHGGGVGCALGCIILSFGLTKQTEVSSIWYIYHPTILASSKKVSLVFLDIPKYLAGEAVKGTAGPLVIFRNQQTHPGWINGIHQLTNLKDDFGSIITVQ